LIRLATVTRLLNRWRIATRIHTKVFNSLFCLFFLVIPLAACAAPFATSTTSPSLQVQAAPSSSLTYVAIGASDTFGIGADDPVTQSWPVDLAGKLGPRVRLINLGIPGIDTPDAVNMELPVALDTHPALITVWLATNDLIDKVPLNTYEHDLTSLLQSLRTADPHTIIMVANIPDLALLPRFQQDNVQQLETTIAGYNTAISTAVEQSHAVLVDLYQQEQTLADHPEYISSDGFHPNALGYEQVAAIFYQTYQKYKP
jgi:lysophospholipase L1-like esterase